MLEQRDMIGWIQHVNEKLGVFGDMFESSHSTIKAGGMNNEQLHCGISETPYLTTHLLY